MPIGQRVEARLKALGISQAELARRAKIPQTTVNSLIREDRRSSPHLVKLANALQTTPSYLAGEEDDPELGYAGEVLAEDEREWLELLRRISDIDRKPLLAMARSLAKTGSG